MSKVVAADLMDSYQFKLLAASRKEYNLQNPTCQRSQLSCEEYE